MGKRIDLTGQRFGRLVVISLNEEVSKQKRCSYWNCKCDCGNETVVRAGHLKSGDTQSCGCYQKEKTKEKWQDEEYRQMKSEKAKEQMKEQWKDEEFRQMQTRRLEKLWDNEEFRQMQSDKMKETSEKLWGNEEFRQMQSDKMKEKWQDEEYREYMSKKISLANENRWSNEEYKKEVSIHMSEAMKERWKNDKYRNRMTGENSPSYKKELTEEERMKRREYYTEGYDKWKQDVKKQYNYTCDCCGDNSGGNLVSHHKDSFNWCKERRTDLSNGVCLCEKCHTEFHRKYGYGDNTEAQYIEFKANFSKLVEALDLK